MQGRTFYRTMLDIILNNTVVKTVLSYVKFCNEQRYYNNRELKFLKNMPINKADKNPFCQKQFLFNTEALKEASFK